MVKKVRRSNVKDGILLPLGNGFSLVKGNHPNKVDDVDIGPNNKTGLSVNHGEILQQKGNTLRVFSAEPMLGGVSPVQLLYGGMAPDKVFAMQEGYKDVHGINDDGSRQHAQFGILKKIKQSINKHNNNKKQTLLKGIDWSGIKTTNDRAYNQKYINYINDSLVNYGYNNNQRAAILANIIEESGGDPFAEGPGGYYGLLQWGSDRYVKTKEKDVYKEIDNQLKYLYGTISETKDKKSWTHGGKGSGYNSFTDAMDAYNSDELNKVMHGFTWGYVRPAGKQNSYLNRQKVADQLINLEGFKYGGKKQFQTGGKNKNNGFKIVKQRTDFQPTKFKTFLRRLYASDNSDSAANRYGDFSRMYFGMPLTDGLLYESNYKPTMAKNPNAKYYGVTDVKFINDVIELYNHPGFLEKPHTGVVDGYSTKGPKIYPWQGEYLSDDLGRDLANNKKVKIGKTPHTLGPGALGNFTISRGKDENGEYLSYYDLWDVDPKKSHKAEERGFAKGYEIYDRIYGTFDSDGTFHSEGEIPAAVTTANKKFGGIYIKPSKRGTFTAAAKQHGMGVQEFASKVLANKENYSHAMVKKANFARNASKWNHLYGGESILINPLGERPNAKYRKQMKNKRNKVERGGIKSIGGYNFPKSFIDQYGNTIGIDGTISKLAVPSVNTGLVNPPKINSIGNLTKNSGLSTTAMSAIGAGINTLGSLIGAGIQQGAINSLEAPKRTYTLLNPVKFKTKININPQIARMREMQAQIADAARRTSGSSRTAYQKMLTGHNRLLDSAMDLYGRKENAETELINRDRLNQQQIAHTNAANVMNTVNYNNEASTEMRNRKRVATSNNWTTALNTTAGAWAGPNGFIDRANALRVKAGELYTQAIANPTAARLLYGDIDFTTGANKRKAFNTIYDFLNNNRFA